MSARIPSGYAPNGAVVYRGPSRIDGRPIVVIATGLGSKSVNAKTGAMVQTWILCADIDPLEALRTGRDSTICGACIFRPAWHDGSRYGARECYVNVSQAPLNVWRTWRRGRYFEPRRADLAALFSGATVRLGSYGDPAAVPAAVWSAILSRAAGHTGYTHQARAERLRDVLSWCQVSADCAEDARAAAAAGIGSFRVLAESEEPEPFEVWCPASPEGGARASCAECRMCSGADGANVAIRSHGIGAGVSPNRGKRRALSLPVLNPARALVT